MSEAITQGGLFRRFAMSGTTLVCLGFAAGAGALYFTFARGEPETEIEAPNVPRSPRVNYTEMPPEPAAPPPAPVEQPVTNSTPERVWTDVPEEPEPTKEASQEKGPMFGRANGGNRSRPPAGQQEASLQPQASTPARGGVDFKPLRVEGHEAIVIEDLERTLRPGTRIACTLVHAIDGTQAGPFLCQTKYAVKSWSGNTDLIQKGEWVTGTTQPLNIGQGRMMAIAATISTGSGLMASLGSAPVTDPLGRLGMPGQVDNRFWDRVGNALITDAALNAFRLPQAALRSQSKGVQFSANDTQDVVNQVLQSTADLPPLFNKNQGEEITILITAPVHFGALRFEVTR